MAEALKEDKKQFGPQALNTPYEKLGERAVVQNTTIDVDFDKETDEFLKKLGISTESEGERPKFEDSEQKDKKYYTAALKVYEIANRFSRDSSPMSDDQKTALHQIKVLMPVFIREEEEVANSANQNISKLLTAKASIPSNNQESINEVEARIKQLDVQARDSKKRLIKLRAFDKYVGMLFDENNSRIKGEKPTSPKLEDAKTSEVIRTIEIILNRELDETEAETRGKETGRSGLDYVTMLKNQLEEGLREITQAGGDFSALQYEEARNKINNLIETLSINTMTYPQLVDVIIKRNLDPYISDAQMIGGEKDKLIVNRFQTFSLPEGASEEEKRDFHRARIKIFCHRFSVVYAGKEEMPTANTDKLYELMDPEKWGLTRIDILSFTNDDERSGINNRNIGENVQEMLAYLIQVGGKREGKTGYEPINDGETNEKDATYSEAIKTVEGKNPKKRLKAFAYKKFVSSKKTRTLSEEDFELAWQLYYTYDLFDIGLALRQKWTQTKASNTHQKNDPNYLTRPFHVGAQKLNRYGNDVNSLMWLFQFCGTYPDTWAYAEGQSEFDGIKKRQELVIAFTDAAMPKEGIVHTIFADPRDPEQQEAFAKDFLTASERKVGISISLEEAKRRFTEQFAFENKDQIREMKEDILSGGATTSDLNELLDKLYAKNFDVYYSRMWDQPIFPDHYDFLTKPLQIDENVRWTEAQSLANYVTAQRGWQNVLDMVTGDITSDNRITYSGIFDDGGLWGRFINEGLGLAKLVPGNHQKLFAPMLRYFIGRISASFVSDPGKNEVEERRRLAVSLIKSLEQAMKNGEGGLYGLQYGEADIRSIVADLNNYEHGPFAIHIWNRVPEILRPESVRLEEYRMLVRKEFEQKYKKPSPPENWRTSVSLAIPAAGLILSGPQYSKDELTDFRDMMNRIEWPTPPASRKKDVDTTQSKKTA